MSDICFGVFARVFGGGHSGDNGEVYGMCGAWVWEDGEAMCLILAFSP